MDCDGPKHALIRDLDGRFVDSFPAEGSIVPFAELRYIVHYTLTIMSLANELFNSLLPIESLVHVLYHSILHYITVYHSIP